jgi:hypothetical protein
MSLALYQRTLYPHTHPNFHEFVKVQDRFIHIRTARPGFKTFMENLFGTLDEDCAIRVLAALTGPPVW